MHRFLVSALAVLLPASVGCSMSPESSAAGQAAIAIPTELMVESGTVALHVEIAGRAKDPVLLAINGGPGLSHHYMAKLARLASSGFRVVFYDQRGTGASSSPADPALFRFEDYTADIEAIRNALGVESMHVLGHSWGGGVALAYGAQYPSHISSLTLIDNLPPTTRGFMDGHARMTARQTELKAQGLMTDPAPAADPDDCGPLVRATLPAYFAEPQFEMTKELAETSCKTSSMQATFAAAIGNYDLTASLASVSAPTHVLFGDSDAYGLEWQAQTVSALSGAAPRVTRIAGAGHYPWMDQSDTTFEALEAFYASVLSSSGAQN